VTVVAVDGGHARGQTPYAWTGPVRSTRRPGRSTGPLLGLEFFRDKAGIVNVTVAPKALKRAQDHRQLTMRNWTIAMERRIKKINRFTVGRTADFCFADTSCRSTSSTSGRAAG
jgi:hypothetical protein